MSSSLPINPTDVLVPCASCGTELTGPFCHQCGEKRLDRHDYAFGNWLAHTLDAFTDFDFKVVRSLWSLLRRPGQMTAEVLTGRRVPWTKPIQVFIIANLVYYVVADALKLNTFQTPLHYHLLSPYGATAHTWSAANAARLGLDMPAYEARFDTLTHTLAKSLVIFFVPVFALLFGLLARRARRYALEHVTVALHFTSLLLLLLPLPYPVVYGLLKSGLVDRTNGDAIWTGATGLMLGYYAGRFLPRVYGMGCGAARAQAVLLVFLFYAALVFLYRSLLFFIAHALL